MFERLSEYFGWYGVLAIVGAYGLATFELVEIRSPLYQLLNLTGAIGMMIDAYYDKNIQPIVLNLIWAGVALYGLISLL